MKKKNTEERFSLLYYAPMTTYVKYVKYVMFIMLNMLCNYV